MNFVDKLRHIQRSNRTLLCLGLDTDVSKLPRALRRHKNPQLEFNRRIIDATADLVCAFKINAAFYEAEGERGREAMEETLRAIPRRVVSIADVKRGDIGNSSERYASAYLRRYKFDAVTVSAYMGEDSVEPFLRSAEQCAFILALTSNAGAKDFQRLKLGRKYLYEQVVSTALRWNKKRNIGFVVGANSPRELRSIRTMAPSAPLLIPGVGTQGGSVQSTVRFGCDKRGELAVINASRSIIYASSGQDFAEAARAEVIKLRGEINFWREKYFGSTGNA